jgi:endonuclease/exonuclease/phosphatase family metal-dependent hydrolase
MFSHAYRCAFLLLPLGIAVSGCSTTSSKTASPAPAHAEAVSEIRIGTYNVFSGTRDTNQTLAVIRRMNADVIALQEIAPQGAVMLDSALEKDYPYRCFSNGLAIVSRFPLSHPRFQRSQRGINGFLVVEVDHPRGRMQIANLHLDPLRVWTTGQKLMLPIQLMWRQGSIHRSELRQVLEILQPDLPTVLLGDFNSASQAAPDTLRALGYIDSFAAVTRDPQRNYTLRYSMLGFHSGRRIDFIFHDHTFETTESRISPGLPSDHNPVVSVLRYRRDTSRRAGPARDGFPRS